MGTRMGLNLDVRMELDRPQGVLQFVLRDSYKAGTEYGDEGLQRLLRLYGDLAERRCVFVPGQRQFQFSANFG